MKTKHHTAFVPPAAVAELNELISSMRLESQAGAIEMILAGFRGKLLDAVLDAFPKCRPATEDVESWVRLQLRLSDETVTEIDQVYGATPLRKMLVIGVLLGGNLGGLRTLFVASARGEKEPTDGGPGTRDRDGGSAAAR